MSNLLFINVYAVTRYCYSRAEGGCYYDAGQPLASVPIQANELMGHDSSCYNCSLARLGEVRDGKKIEYCRVPMPEGEHHALLAEGHTEDGEVYRSVERQYAFETHLVLADKQAAQLKIQELEAMFADEKHGSIYSVNGGTDVWVRVEEHFARPWPESRPTYE